MFKVGDYVKDSEGYIGQVMEASFNNKFNEQFVYVETWETIRIKWLIAPKKNKKYLPCWTKED